MSRVAALFLLAALVVAVNAVDKERLEYFAAKIAKMKQFDGAKYQVYSELDKSGKTVAHESKDGTTSQVVYATEIGKKRDVIIKRVFREFFTRANSRDPDEAYQAAVDRAFNEIRMNQLLQQGEPVPFIPQLYDTYKADKMDDDPTNDYDLVLVYELVGGQNALDMLRANKDAKLETKLVAESVMVGAIVAHELQKKGMVYKGFRLSHFVYNGENQPYIVDFGSSEVLKKEHNEVTFSPPASRAPELWKGETFDNKVDVFALGVIIFNMLAKATTSPFDLGYTRDAYADRRDKTLANMKKGIKAMLKEQAKLFPIDMTRFDKECVDLMEKMLKVNPAERFTLTQVMEHPFFRKNGVTKDAVLNRDNSGNKFGAAAAKSHRTAGATSLQVAWQNRNANAVVGPVIEHSAYKPVLDQNSVFQSHLSMAPSDMSASQGTVSSSRDSTPPSRRMSRRSSRSGTRTKQSTKQSTRTGTNSVSYTGTVPSSEYGGDGSVTPTQQSMMSRDRLAPPSMAGGRTHGGRSQLPGRMFEEPSNFGVNPQVGLGTDMTSLSTINRQRTAMTMGRTNSSIRMPSATDSQSSTSTIRPERDNDDSVFGDEENSSEASKDSISNVVNYSQVTFGAGSSAYGAPPGSSGPISNFPTDDELSSPSLSNTRHSSRRTKKSTRETRESRSQASRSDVPPSGRASKLSSKPSRASTRRSGTRPSQAMDKISEESNSSFLEPVLDSASSATPTQSTVGGNVGGSAVPSNRPSGASAPGSRATKTKSTRQSRASRSQTGTSHSGSVSDTITIGDRRAQPMPGGSAVSRSQMGKSAMTGMTNVGSMHSNWTYNPSGDKISFPSSVSDATSSASDSSYIGNDISVGGKSKGTGISKMSTIDGISNLELATHLSHESMDPNNFEPQNLSVVSEIPQSSGASSTLQLPSRRNRRSKRGH